MKEFSAELSLQKSFRWIIANHDAGHAKVFASFMDKTVDNGEKRKE